jgi:hypothetical protein
MHDAIAEALHSHVLIFAAASNPNNVTSVTFPARLFPVYKLLCMFATTASAKPCSFNPPAIRKARFNFAILGEDIILPPLQNQPPQKPLCGTFFSTIVGAGVAAWIIDFSRHPDIRGNIDNVEYLNQVEGMSAVFAQMVSVIEANYHCLMPWKLLESSSLENKLNGQIRQDICKKISTALMTRYDI